MTEVLFHRYNFLENDHESKICSNGIKAIAPSFIFDVALPSIDVYSDFSLILGWYWNRHWKYAISMSIPLLVQFFFTIYKWCRLEKKENKKWSWPILLLQFWPQWRAIRIMGFHLQNDKKAEEKKKEMMQEISSTEPFLEAWPSIIIMTIIIIIASNDYSFSKHCENDKDDEECLEYLDSIYQPPKYCSDYPESTEVPFTGARCAIYSGFGGKIWFFITFSISSITGSLGITKFLQVGPFSVLSTEGPLGGICRWRFALAFLSVLTSMFAKGCFIAIFAFRYILVYILISSQEYQNHRYLSSLFVKNVLETFEVTDNPILQLCILLLLLGMLIFPNMLYSFMCIAYSTGPNKKFIEVILAYPAGWMLPIATYFVIGPKKSSCCCKTYYQWNHLGFSKFHTIINIVLTVVIYAALDYYHATFASYIFNIWMLFGPLLFVSLIFNIVFLSLDENICFSKSQQCLCVYCCSYECYTYETHVIDTDTNSLKVVKIDV